MRTVVRLLVAFCAWLGIFEPQLIEALQVLPAATVAGALNLGDWILLALVYGVVSVTDTLSTLAVTRMMQRRQVDLLRASYPKGGNLPHRLVVKRRGLTINPRRRR
jgi:hypothetical protein